MERLKIELDGESFGKLEAQKFTNVSLKHITVSVLEDIGIIEKGPQVLILSVANELTQCKPSGQLHTNTQAGPSRIVPGVASESVSLRHILEADAIGRDILYTKIDARILPNHRELLAIVRILCSRMKTKLLNDKESIKTSEKTALAKQIIEEFPFLAATKHPNSPDYSYFFWQNGGKQRNHEHTGLIQQHIRYLRKKLKPEDKKYTRTKVNTVSSVPTDIIELAEVCARKDAVSANYDIILESMEKTHSLYLMMVQKKKPFQQILQTFPHFKSFHGVVIQKAYERIMPKYNKNCVLRKIFARGLLYESELFKGIEDDDLRGCLRLMLHLKRRGLKNHIRGPDQELNIEDMLASDLIRFVSDEESSLAEQLAKYAAYNHEHNSEPVSPHLLRRNGIYHLYIDGVLVECGDNSGQAMDVLFKAFSVFNITVPAALRKLHDLIEVACYKIREHSTRQCVNKLSASLLESCKNDL